LQLASRRDQHRDRRPKFLFVERAVECRLEFAFDQAKTRECTATGRQDLEHCRPAARRWDRRHPSAPLHDAQTALDVRRRTQQRSREAAR
jgi:hypothetical protein